MSQGMTLYEIGAELKALEMVLWENGGELTPEVEAKFNQLAELERDKVDAYYQVCTELTKFAAACGDEAEVFKRKQQTAVNSVKAIKAWMQRNMELRNLKELKGEFHTAAIQGNGGLAPLQINVPVEQLDTPYVRTNPEPDNQAIREAMGADGKLRDLAGKVIAELLPRGKQFKWK